jgi:uncharacterized protein YecT (DUF1311 family)
MRQIFFICSAAVVFRSAFPICGLAQATIQERTDLLYTSPSGALRIETTVKPSSTGDELTAETWVVSTKDPTQRARLPKQSADSPDDDEFHCSPNDEWIFGLRHVGSGLRYGNLYHYLTPLRIEMSDKDESFNELVWKNCIEFGALKEDYSAEGVYAVTIFVGWSLDSCRLLVELSGGEEKSAMHRGRLYFNTRTKRFEMTDYVRKLNRSKSAMLACAEPVEPLPSEAELKTRLDRLDQQLNKTYGELVAKTQKDRVSLLREGQRAWIKHRDEGVKFYVSLFPQTERERRRLQFMGDVTAARIEELPKEWE